jgi:hypothetical protein
MLCIHNLHHKYKYTGRAGSRGPGLQPLAGPAAAGRACGPLCAGQTTGRKLRFQDAPAAADIWELVHLDIMDIYRYLYIYIYLLCVLRYLDIHLLIEHIHLLMEHIHVWICIDIYV